MITAKDVAKAIDENDPKIDQFIEKELMPKFLVLGRSISISTSTVSEYFDGKISNRRFQDQLRKRGFYIKEDCDDRPCGGCWYEIQVPPQGE